MKIAIGKRYEDADRRTFFVHGLRHYSTGFPVIAEREEVGELHSFSLDGRHVCHSSRNLVKLHEPSQPKPYTRKTFVAAGLVDALFCADDPETCPWYRTVRMEHRFVFIGGAAVSFDDIADDESPWRYSLDHGKTWHRVREEV